MLTKTLYSRLTPATYTNVWDKSLENLGGKKIFQNSYQIWMKVGPKFRKFDTDPKNIYIKASIRGYTAHMFFSVWFRTDLYRAFV